ncbi:hypothetical protein KXD40_001236 [Peronospora effusa]|nr:hypothetical protein KXD40_001236 [Peronospora effusa]
MAKASRASQNEILITSINKINGRTAGNKEIVHTESDELGHPMHIDQSIRTAEANVVFQHDDMAHETELYVGDEYE